MSESDQTWNAGGESTGESAGGDATPPTAPTWPQYSWAQPDETTTETPAEPTAPTAVTPPPAPEHVSWPPTQPNPAACEPGPEPSPARTPPGSVHRTRARTRRPGPTSAARPLLVGSRLARARPPPAAAPEQGAARSRGRRRTRARARCRPASVRCRDGGAQR